MMRFSPLSTLPLKLRLFYINDHVTAKTMLTQIPFACLARTEPARSKRGEGDETSLEKTGVRTKLTTGSSSRCNVFLYRVAEAGNSLVVTKELLLAASVKINVKANSARDFDTEAGGCVMSHDLRFQRRLLMASLLGAAVYPAVVEAYVGPGLGLSVIGTIFAFLGALFLAVIGFIWYPIKRLFRHARRRKAPNRTVRKISSEEAPRESGVDIPAPKKLTL